MKESEGNHLSKKKLITAALIRYGSAFLIVAVLLFAPAGSFAYWNAWLYLAAMFLPILFFGVYLLKRDPALLAKRMQAREREKTQKIVIVLSIAVFFAAFALPGLDFRFHWSKVSLPAVLVACAFLLGGYALFVAVMVQNSYASRVVEVQQGQKIIDTGVYAAVRHPMYLASIILFLATPFVLGSYVALIPMLIYPAMLIVRIRNEEKVLLEGLPGYDAYRKKVRYRLIPFVW